MNIISDNPFRILGLLSDATLKEQTKQISKLKMYLEAEQEPQVDYSFPVLGQFKRSVEIVTAAAAKLTLDKDKMEAALFWYYNGNTVTDEQAFDALKESNIQTAYDIWAKRTLSGTLTQSNCSAFQNLSSLLLFLSIKGNTINEKYFEEGISLKLKFLESDFVFDFKFKVTDDIYKPTKKELQLSFLNIVVSELGRFGDNKLGLLIELLSTQSFSAKDDFLKSLVQKPIQQIEAKIEAAKTKRKNNKASALEAGKELYNNIRTEYNLLKSIIGLEDLKFSSISDKISEEILQCGIDYFNFYCDKDFDPSTITMDLFEKARFFAIGKITLQRNQVQIENLNEWIKNAKTIKAHNRIKFPLERINKIITNISNYDEIDAKLSINSYAFLGYDQFLLKKFTRALKNCNQELSTIKDILKNEFPQIIIQIEDIILSGIFNSLIQELNTLSQPLNFRLSLELKQDIKIIIKELDNFNCNAELKKWYIENRKKIMSNFLIKEEDLLPEIKTSPSIQKKITTFEQFYEKITELPTWSKWVIGISVYLIIIALSNSCGK
jgi:hypothetical protein